MGLNWIFCRDSLWRRRKTLSGHSRIQTVTQVTYSLVVCTVCSATAESLVQHWLYKHLLIWNLTLDVPRDLDLTGDFARSIRPLWRMLDRKKNRIRYHGEHICLTHWDRVTHICVGTQTIIGSDNGLAPGRRQAIIWTSAGILFIGPLGANFNEIVIEIDTLLFKKMHLKMSSGKWRPCCLGLIVVCIMYMISGGQVLAAFRICSDLAF